MSEVPSAQWGVDQYLEWLQYAFQGLRNTWPDDESTRAYPWSSTCRSNFLGILDVSESQLDTAPELPVLRQFINYVDEKFSDDVERRRALLDTGQQRSILDECVRAAVWSAPAPAAPPPPGLDTFYWVTNEQADALGADWRTVLRTQLDKNYPGWYQNTTAAPLVKWLSDWWPTITATRKQLSPAPVAQQAAAPKGTAQQSAAPKAAVPQPNPAQAAAIVGDLAQQIRAARKDLASGVPDDLFQQVLAEVLAERVAARR